MCPFDITNTQVWRSLLRFLGGSRKRTHKSETSRRGVTNASRRLAGPGGLVIAALLFAGCETGFTTGATDIAKQPDGSYSARLHFVASCASGDHCS